ncbi:MAG TPA: TlpA disulfide reductase family protein [Pyrinomonadaceae bacterium]|nr:TlpA disulfide reductase family protein [Pyrinomonadaceae bacterium]
MSKRFPKFAKLALVLVMLAAVLPATPAGAAEALNFNLRSADGGQITSEMLRGDVVVLAFGSASLPPSLARRAAHDVQELANEYAEREVRVYWVSTDSDSPKSKSYAADEDLRAFARKYGLKIAVLRDPEGTLFKRTGLDQLPAVVILNRAGEIAGDPIGGLDPRGKLVDQLSPRLNELLK